MACDIQYFNILIDYFRFFAFIILYYLVHEVFQSIESV